MGDRATPSSTASSKQSWSACAASCATAKGLSGSQSRPPASQRLVPRLGSARRRADCPVLQRTLPHRLVPLHLRQPEDVVHENVERTLLALDPCNRSANLIGNEVI